MQKTKKRKIAYFFALWSPYTAAGHITLFRGPWLGTCPSRPRLKQAGLPKPKHPQSATKDRGGRGPSAVENCRH